MLCRRTLISLGILQFWSNWIAPALAQQTFFPSAVPLAVRTPTFSCWLDTRNGSNPMSTWPQFWNDQHVLGWAGYIKVDGMAYHWLGQPIPGNASTWLATTVTPTRTILTVQAGPMRLNVTFLSPIEPGDWARQSFPFSYVYLDGKATDGQSHSIQLYSDISGEWVTNDFGTGIQWSSSQTSNTVFHQVGSTTPTNAFKDMAEDAIAYHAISSVQPNLVSVVGTDQALRSQFTAAGEGFTLTADLAGNVGNVRGNDGKFPVLAHALNLGTTDTITTVAWAVGVVRDPILTFAGVPRRAYYWSQHGTVSDAIDAFMTDFPAARARAIALDQKILQDAAAVSPEYADLVSLATRQAMAGMEITLSTLPDGSFNMSDVKAFMKDVGNSQRVNPTEAIYAALPAFMYLDANITGALLEPLLEYQGSSSYSNSYAAPDLGTPFPSVPGNPGNNVMYGVENSGNMLILVLAHAQSSGDGSLIGKYYDLLKRWGDYLISNALIPGQQTPADARDTGLAQTHGNITNLALKGIIAIQAMAEISQVMGQTADEQKYETAAKSLMQSWINLTSVSGQLRWTYGASTFGLMYNLLADKLLKLNVVPASIYTTEASILSNNPPQQAFGIALSSDSNSNTRSDWTLFSAAAADNHTRDLLISGVHNHASSNLTGGAFPTLYNVQTGQGPGVGASPNGFASPAQGAMFSVFALNVANKTVVVPSPAGSAPPASSSGVPSAKSNAGAIAGGVVGGVAVLLLLGGVAIFLRRRRGQRDRNDGLEAPRPYQAPPNMVAVFGDSSLAPTSPSSNSNHVPPSRAPGAGLSFASPKAALMSGVPGSLGPESMSPPASSHQPSSSGVGSSVSRGTDELRSEMERLRYEVEQLRATQGVPQEAPPGYD
ncbi:hypothetical protein DFH08DRAFT_808969 [Mycena albidolilacea]|uniref:DUF1793-domain-containing protein n=1 Tax=Mycena albidolilacea TaxID=1033008 RepID=A0AAD7A0N5_9AGAR|nr:hypothetical protein DFH08DRAFT_808969 [Mycena albidolilacea]